MNINFKTAATITIPEVKQLDTIGEVVFIYKNVLAEIEKLDYTENPHPFTSHHNHYKYTLYIPDFKSNDKVEFEFQFSINNFKYTVYKCTIDSTSDITQLSTIWGYFFVSK